MTFEQLGEAVAQNESDQAGSYQTVEEYNAIVKARSPRFAETLNFYISDSENGISRVPRQKLVEIQTELRRLTAALQQGAAPGGKPVRRLELWQVPAHELDGMELEAEYAAAAAKFDNRGEHGGSPGEFWAERMDEIDHERKRRGHPRQRRAAMSDTAKLIAELRTHAEVQIEDNLAYIGKADALMCQAAFALEKFASANAIPITDLEQILHDPENQPSQFGTVPADALTEREGKAIMAEAAAIDRAERAESERGALREALAMARLATT